MKISIGSDHAGYLYKEEIKKYLAAKNIEVIDCGTYSQESCDYPIFAKKAALMVANGEADYGILVCSSGEGIMITANKVKGIRCGIGYNDDVARLIKQHNNANMIAFGASFMDLKDVLHRIDIFLNTEFEGGRHLRRVNEIE
ncbi:MAG TPA: ribose 5-phosphate isomerase B [Firmicutes bacterium]|nr:ribose 5-phosphate isomerase B [Bacillota bacterium]